MTEMVGAIDEIMAELKPEELYLPYPSLHQDHIAVYEAGMRSCRVSMSLDHWFPPSVYVYDIAVYDVNLYPTDLRWNVFEALTEEQITAEGSAPARPTSRRSRPRCTRSTASARSPARSARCGSCPTPSSTRSSGRCASEGRDPPARPAAVAGLLVQDAQLRPLRARRARPAPEALGAASGDDARLLGDAAARVQAAPDPHQRDDGEAGLAGPPRELDHAAATAAPGTGRTAAATCWR